MRILAACCLLLACAKGQVDLISPSLSGDIPQQDLLLRIHCNLQEVEFGKAFTLSVQRVWRKDLIPDDWDDAKLEPLTIKLVTGSRREDERRVEEIMTFDAFLFSRETLRIPAIEFSARTKTGDPALQVHSEALELRVRSLIDAESPGNAELPGGPLEEPASTNILYGSLAAILAMLAFIVWGFWQRSPDRDARSMAAETPLNFA